LFEIGEREGTRKIPPLRRFVTESEFKDLPGGAYEVDGRGVALMLVFIYYRDTRKSSEK